jgi:hypothetical protein
MTPIFTVPEYTGIRLHTSETSVTIYQTTQCYIPQDINLHTDLSLMPGLRMVELNCTPSICIHDLVLN